MFFSIEEGKLSHQGQIIYRSNDLAFDFLPHQIGNCTVLIGTINMDFIIYHGGIKRASQIWGYHPNVWIREELHLPQFIQGNLILADNVIEDADIIQLEGSLQWQTYYDTRTDWVCIGNNNHERHDEAVEFATDIVAVVSEKKLKSLWVRPLMQ